MNNYTCLRALETKLLAERKPIRVYNQQDEQIINIIKYASNLAWSGGASSSLNLIVLRDEDNSV